MIKITKKKIKSADNYLLPYMQFQPEKKLFPSPSVAEPKKKFGRKNFRRKAPKNFIPVRRFV